MFNKKKKKEDKELEFKLRIIEKLDTLELRNTMLYERVKDLEIALAKHIDGGHN
jgi:hypothetical protein